MAVAQQEQIFIASGCISVVPESNRNFCLLWQRYLFMIGAFNFLTLYLVIRVLAKNVTPFSKITRSGLFRLILNTVELWAGVDYPCVACLILRVEIVMSIYYSINEVFKNYRSVIKNDSK